MKQIASFLFPEMKGGDLIMFGGTGFVSEGIETITHSPFSHAALVLEPTLLIDGQMQRQVNIIESTTLTGRKGVQINPLDTRLANYDDGGRAWWMPLSDHFRAWLDWDAAWKFALGEIAKGVTYNYVEIGCYVARLVPILGKLPLFDRASQKAVVCSEFCCDVFRAGGALPGVDDYKTPPGDLARMQIYRDRGPIQIMGAPVVISHFNER